MKIIYDSYIFTEQSYGGISRYFYELIKSFNKRNDIKVLAPLVFSNNQYITDKKHVNHLVFFPNKKIKGKQRLLFLINRIAFFFVLQKKDFDIVHPTYYDTYYLKHIGKKKLVLTVYDMIHEKFTQDKISEKKRLLCERADLIIAISENTKKDLIEVFNILESKIRVIHLASSLQISKKNKINTVLPESYILFVGHRGLYKNFNRFISAVSKLMKNDKTLHVICAGGNNFEDKEISMFRELDIENRVVQFNMNDDFLSYLYSNALLFVFPSLYEGFGIPLLESFSCGCPVACSNTSSFPEVAMDGAVYFDPKDEESIYECISEVLYDDSCKKALVKNAYRRLESFSWEETAEKTKQIYDEVMQ